MSKCPTCGTEFEAGTEAWLLQKEHCPKHDFVHPAGTECDHCVAEAAKAEEEANAEPAQD